MARDKASCANNVCCATDTAAVKARLEKRDPNDEDDAKDGDDDVDDDATDDDVRICQDMSRYVS